MDLWYCSLKTTFHLGLEAVITYQIGQEFEDSYYGVGFDRMTCLI